MKIKDFLKNKYIKAHTIKMLCNNIIIKTIIKLDITIT